MAGNALNTYYEKMNTSVIYLYKAGMVSKAALNLLYAVFKIPTLHSAGSHEFHK